MFASAALGVTKTNTGVESELLKRAVWGFVRRSMTAQLQSAPQKSVCVRADKKQGYREKLGNQGVYTRRSNLVPANPVFIKPTGQL